MNIKQLIKDCHEATIEKGFYDCKTCKGKKHGYNDETGIETCPTCGGTGINENRNIGELLMLIVSELSEALEAHRNNKHTQPQAIVSFLKDITDIKYFKVNIKDTFEDEIADVFIRLFDLCGYLKIKPVKYVNSEITLLPEFTENVGSNLKYLATQIMRFDKPLTNNKLWASYQIYDLDVFCRIHNIPIEKHIKAKMEYNKTRPHKHGKEY